MPRASVIAAYVDPRALPVTEDFPVYAQAQVTGTRGRMGLRDVAITHAGGTSLIEARTLGLAGGWNPTLHLACHLNGRPVWDDGLAAFAPRPGMVPGLSAAGAARGVFSTAACLPMASPKPPRRWHDLGLAAPANATAPAGRGCALCHRPPLGGGCGRPRLAGFRQ